MERRFKDKKLRGPSITLERQENTTVKRVGETYIQRKHTRVRELFTRTVNTQKTDIPTKESRTLPSSAIVSTPIVEQQARKQETSPTSSDTRLRQTEFQLQALNQEIEHEIFELKRFRDNLLNKQSRTRSKKESRNKAGDSRDSKSGEKSKGNTHNKSKKTWGENLASNKKKSNNMIARSFRHIDVFVNDEIRIHSPRIRNMGVQPINTTEQNDQNQDNIKSSPKHPNANNLPPKRIVAGCTFGHNDEMQSVYQLDFGRQFQCGQQNCQQMCSHFQQQYNASTVHGCHHGAYQNRPTTAAAAYQCYMPCTPVQLPVGLCVPTQAIETNNPNAAMQNNYGYNRRNGYSQQQTANRVRTDLFVEDTCRERSRLVEAAGSRQHSPTRSKQNDRLKQSTTTSKMKSRKNVAPGSSKHRSRNNEVEKPQLPRGLSDIHSLHKYQVKSKEKLIKVTLVKSSDEDSRQDISPDAQDMMNSMHISESDKQQMYDDYIEKYNAEKEQQENESELLQMQRKQSSSSDTKLRSDATYTKLEKPPKMEEKNDSTTEILYSNVKQQTDDTNLREMGITAIKEQLEKDTQVEKEKRLSTVSQTQTDAVSTRVQESQSNPAEEQQHQGNIQDMELRKPTGAYEQSDVIPPPAGYQSQINQELDSNKFSKRRESEPQARIHIRDSIEKALNDYPRRSHSDTEHLHLRRCMAFEQRQCNRTKMQYVAYQEQNRERYGSTAYQQRINRSDFMHYDRRPPVSSNYYNSSPRHLDNRHFELPCECPRIKNTGDYISNSAYHTPRSRSSQRSAIYTDACSSTTSITTAVQQVTYTTRPARNLQGQQQEQPVDNEESDVEGIRQNNELPPTIETSLPENAPDVAQTNEPQIGNDEQLTSELVQLGQQERLDSIAIKDVEPKPLEMAPQSRQRSDDFNRVPRLLNSPRSFDPRQHIATSNYVSQPSLNNNEYYSNGRNSRHSPTRRVYASDFCSSAATSPRAQYAEPFRQPQIPNYPANLCQISQCTPRFQSSKGPCSERLTRTVTFEDEFNNLDNKQGQNINRNDIDWERSRQLKTDYQLELENNFPENGSSEDDYLDTCRTCSSGATIRTCREMNPDDDYMTCDESQEDDHYGVLPPYTGCPCMYDTYLRMASHCAPDMQKRH